MKYPRKEFSLRFWQRKEEKTNSKNSFAIIEYHQISEESEWILSIFKKGKVKKMFTRRPAKRTRQIKATEETTMAATAFPESGIVSCTRRNL